MPDWTAVKADYLATGMAYPALAKKWNVSLSTLKKRAMREKWSELFGTVVQQSEPTVPVPLEEKEPAGTKEEPQPGVELVSVEQIAIEARRERYQRMMRTTDAMMDRILDAMELVKPDDTYAIKTLVSALKDLREMQGLNKSALDIEEQKARIAKLKSETRITEADGHGGVLILPTIEDGLLPPGGTDE